VILAVLITFTPNPVAVHPESDCTTNDAPTSGIRLPACAIAKLTPRKLFMMLTPASEVPSCCIQKLDVDVPRDRLTVCVCQALGF
jgi:hypothetical protein